RRPRRPAGRRRPGRSGCPGDGGGGRRRARASLRRRSLRPGAPRLDARAHRCRQRALRPRRRTRRGRYGHRAARAQARPSPGRERARHRPGGRARELRLVPAGGHAQLDRSFRPGGLLRRGGGDLRAGRRGVAGCTDVPQLGCPLRRTRPGGVRRSVRRAEPAGPEAHGDPGRRQAHCAPPSRPDLSRPAPELTRRRQLRRRPSREGRVYIQRGMDFSLTADQREIQALAREFAEAEIVPEAAAWDREHRFPRDLFTKLGELGLMGVCVAEEHGGAGADFLSYVLVLEELSRADAGVGVTVAVHTSAATLPIVAFGTEEQKSRFVPALARGETIGAFALTEPDSGSDAGSLRTTAVPDGDGWLLSGSKQWCTNGSHAGVFLLFARTDAAIEGARGVSAFVLDRDHVEVTREEEKLGLNSSSTADLRLDRVRVGRDRLLHEENRGFAVAMATLDGGRIGIAAQAVGIARAA